MNIIFSLNKFIPEIILFINCIFIFTTADNHHKILLRIRQIFFTLSIIFVLFIYIITWYDRPNGLFYNNFVTDPFSTLFCIILVLTYLTFHFSDIFRITNAEHLLQRFIVLIASILLIKANSYLGLFLCLGIIFIGNIINNYDSLEQSALKSLLLIYTIVLGSILLIFTILYGFSGNLYFTSGSFQSISDSILNRSYINLFLVAALSLFGLILPFLFLKINTKSVSSLSFFNSSYFLPLLAMIASLIRIMQGIFPSGQFEIGTFQKDISLFIIFAVFINIVASFYYYRQQSIQNLFIISLIDHFSLLLPVIMIHSQESLIAIIFSLISNVIILCGIIIVQRNDLKSRLDKLFMIIFYFGLIGIPGTSGFTGKFLIFKSLFQSGIHISFIVLFMLSLFPMIYFITLEISRLIKLKLTNPPNTACLIPGFLALLSIILTIYGEHFISMINKSLVFFK